MPDLFHETNANMLFLLSLKYLRWFCCTFILCCILKPNECRYCNSFGQKQSCSDPWKDFVGSFGGNIGLYNNVPKEPKIHQGRELIDYGAVSALERRASVQGEITAQGGWERRETQRTSIGEGGGEEW